MHPILFELPGGAPLRSYGVLVAIALLVGWIYSLSNAKARGMPVEKLGLGYVLAAVAALVGARMLWVAQNPNAYDGPLSLVRLSAGELALGGGVIAGAVATWAYCRKEGISTLRWFDALAGPLLLGVCLERLGAFMAGTDFGLYAPHNPLAVHFPSGSPAHLMHLRTMTGTVLPASPSLPVHPTQLYALGIAVAGLVLVSRVARAQRFVGQLAMLAFGTYVLARMVVEPVYMAQRDPLSLGGVDLDLLAGSFYLVVVALGYRSLSRREQPKAAANPKAKTGP